MGCTLVRVTLGSAIAAGACLGMLRLLRAAPREWMAELGIVAAGGVLAVAAGYAAMKLMRVEELGALEDLLRATRRRFTGA